ncbi:MAG: hypothetical protein NT040_01105 [Bacteroidetes bacterium]|nr:hypothetical protein [Bacteroidota bacterium]
MKNHILSLFIVGLFISSANMVKAQVSINNDGTAPHASAMLEVKSTAKGFLLPRLTTVQRVALGATATAGLVVYDTDLKKIYSHNGITWDEGGVGNSWLKSGSNVYLSPTTDFVGIGLTNPSKPLEVRGTWQTVRFSSPNLGAGLELVGSSTTNWSVTTWQDLLYLLSSNDQFATKTDEYRFSNTEFSSVTTNDKSLGASARRWSNFYSVAGNLSGTLTGVDAHFTGNVGIGTTAPVGKLDVHDAASNNTTLFITPNNVSIEDSSTLFMSEGADGQTGMYWLYDGVGNQMELWGQYFGSKYGPHLLVNRDNGNVSLGGTFASGYKLSVGGKVICTELRVNAIADWPDYVFKKDYKLMPLAQLGSFIDENGHLPNIPKAADVAKSGLEVGEMQRRMMEKIEELSLYIIGQQKQIDELKEKLATTTR